MATTTRPPRTTYGSDNKFDIGNVIISSVVGMIVGFFIYLISRSIEAAAIVGPFSTGIAIQILRFTNITGSQT